MALAAMLTACAEAPLAPVPAVPFGTAYKEAQAPWVAAEPAEPLPRDGWWRVYQDPDLDQLQQRLLANSPDLAGALVHYQQSRAATDSLRAAQFPTLGASYDVSRNRQSERRPLRAAGSGQPDDYNSSSLGLNLQYELDLWGRVRQQVSAGIANEQAAQADLAGAQLSLQAQLADTVIALRGADQELALLRDTEAAYVRNAEMIERRHRGGLSSGLDLARSQSQLETTRSQLHQAEARRALLEHAIAALVGENASAFAMQAKTVSAVIPAIPVGLPSTLLQRRPDIAAAQRRVAAANASVGVARTAFFPSVTLNGTGGFQTSDLSQFLLAPNLFWAIGPAIALNVFDGGRRKAEVARTEAVLDEAAQTYRGIVLGAFRQVEDQLALLSNYGEAAKFDERAVAASQRALDLANNRYRDGAVSYLDVVVSQTTTLQIRRESLDLATRQRRATVQLVRALGGGWSDDLLTAGKRD